MYDNCDNWTNSFERNYHYHYQLSPCVCLVISRKNQQQLEGARNEHHEDKTKRCCKHSRRPVYATAFLWLVAAHFRSQILATDAFGPLGSCSDVRDEISSTADFDLPPAWPKRPGSARCTRIHHIPSGTRKSASIARLLFACVSSVLFVVLREKGKTIIDDDYGGVEIYGNLFFLCSILLRRDWDERERVEG